MMTWSVEKRALHILAVHFVELMMKLEIDCTGNI